MEISIIITRKHRLELKVGEIMNKKIKILAIITIIILGMFVCSSVFATTGKVDPDAYKPKGLTTSDVGEFVDIANSIIAAIQIFGALVAAIAIIVLGIKYMLGSTQDRAGYKETMIPYLVGAVMAFAIPGIVRVIFDLVTQIKF